MEKVTTWLVGRNAQLVHGNAIAFSCSEPENFERAAGGTIGPRHRSSWWPEKAKSAKPPEKSGPPTCTWPWQ